MITQSVMDTYVRRINGSTLGFIVFCCGLVFSFRNARQSERERERERERFHSYSTKRIILERIAVLESIEYAINFDSILERRLHYYFHRVLDRSRGKKVPRGAPSNLSSPPHSFIFLYLNHWLCFGLFMLHQMSV